MDTKKLQAEKRVTLGRRVKRIRLEGVLPANIYGKKIKSQAISIKLSDFLPVYKEAGETGIITLTVGNKGKPETYSVLISNLQKDPVTDEPIHADLRQVDLKEKISAKVPIELVGEAQCEKTGVGTLVQYIDEVEVEALPADLPEKFEIDISELSEVDAAIYLKDLKFEKSKVVMLDDSEKIVVKVEPPQKEEVAPPPAEETVLPQDGVPPQEGAPAKEVKPETTEEASET